MNPDKPYDFQEDGMFWLKTFRPNSDNPKYGCPAYVGLLADEMGLGKTVTTLETIQPLIESGRRILFLVPGSTTIQWQRQYDKWVLENLPDDFFTTSLYAIKGSKSLIPTSQSCVMSHSLLAKKPVVDRLIAANFDGIVIDEIHKFGSAGTRRIKHLMALMNLTASKFAACRIGLSGTPVRNYAKEIRNIGWFLGFPPAQREEVFRTEYLTYDGKALYNPHKFHRDFNSFYLRRTVDQVQKSLPDIRRTELYTEITDPLIVKLYNRELDLMSNFTKNAEKLSTFSLLGYLVRLRHITGIAKAYEPGIMDPIWEYLMAEDSDTGPRKCVIGIHHKLVSRRVKNYLGECKCGHERMAHFTLDDKTYDDVPNPGHLCSKPGCNCTGYESLIRIYAIHGGQSSEQKEREKQAFIACKAPAICLLSTKAAGEGIDGLQFAASKLYLLECQWNMAEIRQLEKRIHRTGQTLKCHIEYSIATGTVDEFFWDMSKMKEQIATQVEDHNYENNPKFLQTLAERAINSRLKVPMTREADIEEFERITAPKADIHESLDMLETY